MLFLLVTSIALAQRRGGRGGGGKSNPTGVGDTESPEAKEITRAAALQARPDQVEQFQQLTKSDQLAHENVQTLLQHASPTDKPDLFHLTKSLSDSVDEAQTENQRFVQSLSDPQKSGLKELTKKLAKASSELTKENNALNKELERSKVNDSQIVEVVKRLDKALADFQSKQAAIGSEMGIQGAG
jgi:hypothetical protein